MHPHPNVVQARLLEELDTRLSRDGHEALGFAAGAEGTRQALLFRAQMARYMRPHCDGQDWRDTFWDGLAFIAFRVALPQPGPQCRPQC